jgi:hypothetical protein
MKQEKQGKEYEGKVIDHTPEAGSGGGVNPDPVNRNSIHLISAIKTTPVGVENLAAGVIRQGGDHFHFVPQFL